MGVFTTLDAPLSKINVHARGGAIIPMQIPGDNLITGRDNPFTLLVAPSQWGNATGNLFWDDGDSIGISIVACPRNAVSVRRAFALLDAVHNYLAFALSNGVSDVPLEQTRESHLKHITAKCSHCS